MVVNKQWPPTLPVATPVYAKLCSQKYDPHRYDVDYHVGHVIKLGENAIQVLSSGHPKTIDDLITLKAYANFTNPHSPWRMRYLQKGIKKNWKQDMNKCPFCMGVEPKIGGFTPKMDGENNGKPYEQMG